MKGKYGRPFTPYSLDAALDYAPAKVVAVFHAIDKISRANFRRGLAGIINVR